ncbi:Conserved phosducin-like protein [Phaffia rhodozyma]|uniref:Conserved phosducin-like protein n=1 Tax=Phaffia rhodozyma TaxID=264483 RepID=A0A0F7SME6_PHARH|nr:Conserved phosducin-like protein [Phaffia rhodozyma]
MSGDTLEQAVLSGALFRDPSAALDEYRVEDRETPSPEPNTDDELGSDLDDDVGGVPSLDTPSYSVGGGSSKKTGPKGVIRDQREAMQRNRFIQLRNRLEVNERMERKALLGPTWEEEVRSREEDQAAMEDGDQDGDVVARWRDRRLAELRNKPNERQRGFLREVGMDGYLSAVESGSSWVIVLVYEKNQTNTPPYLIPTLQKLASANSPPTHHFLLASARNLSFSLLSNGEPDRDVLPTMLVYRPSLDGNQDAELAHSWIRVDLMLNKDNGGEGVERLLLNNGIIPRQTSEDNEDEDDDELSDDSK